MKSKHITLAILSAIYVAIGMAFVGCASDRAAAPSVALMTDDNRAARASIRTAQTATQQADAKADVILQYLKSQK